MSSFEYRLNRKRDEMRSLFTRLYGSDEALDDLIMVMREYYIKRSDELKALDEAREKDPLW